MAQKFESTSQVIRGSRKIVRFLKEIPKEDVQNVFDNLKLLPRPDVVKIPVITIGNQPRNYIWDDKNKNKNKKKDKGEVTSTPGKGGALPRGKPGGPFIRLHKRIFKLHIIIKKLILHYFMNVVI